MCNLWLHCLPLVEHQEPCKVVGAGMRAPGAGLGTGPRSQCSRGSAMPTQWEMLWEHWKFPALLCSIRLLLKACGEVAFQMEINLNQFNFLFIAHRKCQRLLTRTATSGSFKVLLEDTLLFSCSFSFLTKELIAIVHIDMCIIPSLEH